MFHPSGRRETRKTFILIRIFRSAVLQKVLHPRNPSALDTRRQLPPMLTTGELRPTCTSVVVSRCRTSGPRPFMLEKTSNFLFLHTCMPLELRRKSPQVVIWATGVPAALLFQSPSHWLLAKIKHCPFFSEREIMSRKSVSHQKCHPRKSALASFFLQRSRQPCPRSAPFQSIRRLLRGRSNCCLANSRCPCSSASKLRRLRNCTSLRPTSLPE